MYIGISFCHFLIIFSVLKWGLPAEGFLFLLRFLLLLFFLFRFFLGLLRMAFLLTGTVLVFF